MNERTLRRAQFLIDAAYVAVVALIVYLSLKYVAGWILPFLVAFCIVAVMHPVITRIVKHIGIKQEIVSVSVMALLYLLAGTLLFLLVSQAVFTVRDGFKLLPAYYYGTVQPAITSLGGAFSGFIEDLPAQWQDQLFAMQGDLVSAMQNALITISQKGIAALSGLTGSVPSFMIALIFTIMLSFFISTQYGKITGFFKTQLPTRARRVINDTRVIVIETVFKYFRAALTLMFITFIELTIGLFVLGSKNAMPIAAGIAIFDALPFFGTGAIVIPWIIIELIQGHFTFAAGLAILYALITLIRSIIEPKVVGDKLGLNPVVSLVSIYLGFKIFGMLGMIFMPILTQIMLELHRKGSITLFPDNRR